MSIPRLPAGMLCAVCEDELTVIVDKSQFAAPNEFLCTDCRAKQIEEKAEYLRAMSRTAAANLDQLSMSM